LYGVADAAIAGTIGVGLPVGSLVRPSQGTPHSQTATGWLNGYHFCFTDEEMDFIINYDIKYRTGQDREDDQE
jgi:hypothetical protein